MPLSEWTLLTPYIHLASTNTNHHAVTTGCLNISGHLCHTSSTCSMNLIAFNDVVTLSGCLHNQMTKIVFYGCMNLGAWYFCPKSYLNQTYQLPVHQSIWEPVHLKSPQTSKIMWQYISFFWSHWWPSGYSRRLSDMKCTVMIWRSWVQAPTGLNLGWVVLLSWVVLEPNIYTF